MTSETSVETKGCTFQWKIVNISHCWLKFEERIESPAFIADAVKGTKWCLRLYPMGTWSEQRVEFFLSRVEDCSGYDVVKVSYVIAFLDKDGSILKEINGSSNKSFSKDSSWIFEEDMPRERIFGSEREDFLPEDTLTVQCTLWENEQKPVKMQHLYARTIFELNRRSVVWRIDKFSTLKSEQKNKFKDGSIEFDLVLPKTQDFEKKLFVKFNSFDEDIEYLSLKIAIVDSEGKMENWKTYEYSDKDLRNGTICELFSAKEVSERKSQYLPNDVLSLHCEYAYSTGKVSFEYCGYAMIFPELANEVVASREEHAITKEESRITSHLAKDLKSMYEDATCSNTVLRTSTRTFPVHKGILSARSPVFRSVFSRDMKENNSGYVDIVDFEDESIHQMLLYMYTDSLGDLQCENASSLYRIADKYQILSLRNKCSSFLKDNLCPSNACNVLVLADLHNDDDLKRAAEGYIIGKRKQFFSSKEWKQFMKSHTDIASDIMCRKICEH